MDQGRRPAARSWPRPRRSRWLGAGIALAPMLIVTGVGCSLAVQEIAPVAPKQRCGTRSDCEAARTCLYGLCTLPCAEDRDCPDRERCLRASAITACVGSTEAACTMDSECGDGALCVGDRCRSECDPVTLPCLTGQACVGSVCFSLDSSRDPTGAGDSEAVQEGGPVATAGAGGVGAGGASVGGGATSIGGGGVAGVQGAPTGCPVCPVERRCDPRTFTCVTPLVDYGGDGASFSRSTEASYQVGPGELAWVAPDVLRREDLGDGYGPLPLLEAPSCNLVDPDGLASWSGDGVMTTAANGEGPGIAATRVAATANGVPGTLRQVATATTPGVVSFSSWFRAGSSSRTGFLIDDGATIVERFVVATDQWASATTTTTVGSSPTVTGITVGWPEFPPAVGDSILVAGVQLEALDYPTSLTRQICPAARGADILTLADGAAFRGAFRLHVSPSAPVGPSRDPMALIAFGTNDDDSMLLQYGLGFGQVAVRAGARAVARVSGIVFDGDDVLEIVADPTTGRLAVNGIETTGTPWSWPETTVSIGRTRDSAAPHPFTGRISEPFPQ